MANASTVGALRVVLGLDSAAFERGMTQSQAALMRMGQKMQAVGNTMKIAGAAMVAAFVGVATAAGGAVATLSKSITDLEAQAKTAGVAFDDFQRLKFAADRNSVSVAALTSGLAAMNVSADKFVQTGKGPGAEAFNRLGLGAADLASRLKDPNALFMELIDRMQRLDKAGQMRAANEIFGTSGGAEFVRFLDQGTAGLRAYFQEYERSGNAITERQRANAQKMQEAIQALKDALANLTRALLDTGLVQWFVDVAAGATRLITTINQMVPGFVKWASIIMVGVGALGALLVVTGTVVSSVGSLTAAFAGVAAAITRAGGAMAALKLGMTFLISNVWVLAIMAVVGAIAFLVMKTREATPAQRQLRKSVTELEEATRLYEDAALKASTAQGEARKTALEEANALRVLTEEKLKSAKASLVQARAELANRRARAYEAAQEVMRARPMEVGEAIGQAAYAGTLEDVANRIETDVDEQARQVGELEATLARITAGLNTPASSYAAIVDPSKSGGKSAADLAQEAEQRRRAVEDLAATLNMQEAQLRGNQDLVRVLEREEAVRNRTRALIDAEIITDKAAAAAASEQMQRRLDAAMAEHRREALQDTKAALDLDLARLNENHALVRSLEREAETRDRIKSYEQQGLPTIVATVRANIDLVKLEAARGQAAQRRLADAREEHRLTLAQLSGNERLTRQLQDQAEIRERTRRYQADGRLTETEAAARATSEVWLERAAARHGEAREMFSSAFSDGIRAAMAGDLKGFLSNQFGTFMSEAFKRLGQQLYDSIFGTFDAVAEGTAQGTAQGLAAGPQMIAAGQVVAMTIGDSIRGAGAEAAAMMRGASAGGGESGASALPGALGRVASFLSNLPGFANEGTIRASGASGIDSQLVAFWKSPREQVDIYQPGGRGSGGGGEMIHRVIVTPDRDSFITLAGEAAMPLVESGSHAAFAGSRAQVPADMARSDRYTRGR